MADDPRPVIAVARKWVDLRPDVDPISGAVHDDERVFGCSSADQAALEWALRLAEVRGAAVLAVTAGPPGAEQAVRDALAVGAERACRIDLPADAPSEDVAAALADVVAEADLVLCGDWSLDRGSGSVPALIAAHLDLPQGLGLLRIDVDAAHAESGLAAVRRLDHGRREVIRIPARAVLSFEGGTAELRRARLASVLTAREAEVEVIPGAAVRHRRMRVTHRGPYRPRAAARPAPDPTLDPRQRILHLTGALVDRTPPRTVVAETDEAADLVLEQLRTWGYLT